MSISQPIAEKQSIIHYLSKTKPLLPQNSDWTKQQAPDALDMRGRSVAVAILSLGALSTEYVISTDSVHKTSKSTGSSSNQAKHQLSIDDVNKLLFTEVNTEYGKHRLLSTESHDFWTASIDYEWSRARNAEDDALKKVGALRRAEAVGGKFPYLVCDSEPGKSGESCRLSVTEHFGDEVVVSNLIGFAIALYDMRIS